jgi:hypothetical protein
MLIVYNSFFLTKSNKQKVQNKLQQNNRDTQREIEISNRIRQMDKWGFHFCPIYKIQDISIMKSDERTLKLKTDYLFLKYKLKSDYIDFFNYFHFIYEIKYFERKHYRPILFSFFYILEKIILLEKSNIHFIGFNHTNIKINIHTNNCILSNFNKCFVNNESQNGENQHPYKYDSFKDFQSEYYIFYPIEYHYLKYFIEHNYSSPNIEIFEIVWKDWSSHILKEIQIDESKIFSLKKIYFQYFYSLIHQKREKVINFLENSISNKGSYGCIMLYLYIFSVINNNLPFIDLFLKYIQREKIENEILLKEYEEIIYQLNWEEYIHSDLVKNFKLQI